MRLSLACVAALVGCQGPSRPWEGQDAAAPPAHVAKVAPPAPSGEIGADDGGAAEEPSAEPARVGGPWVRCYGNFRVSGDPVKDLTRLTLLCGPENGMRRLSERPFEGAVVEGGAPVSQSFAAKRGDCYRVFAVAEPAVADLDVRVETSRGMPVAADHGEDAWPVVQPDRPFCALDDDRYAITVTARRGRGRFAGEVWVLPGR